MGKAGDMISTTTKSCGIHGLRTVTEDELSDSGKVHGNASKEVVVATQSDQTLGSDGTLEAAEDEDGGCVRDQEADEAKQCWIGLG